MREGLLASLRLLAFRISREEMLRFGNGHIAFGLLATWLAGVGRYWDDSGAHPLQILGLGSVIYVFLLAGILWVFGRPLCSDDWSYCHVLTFVTLTSPPALLYAIPVERWFTLEAAGAMNAWFLAVVASWRMALLFFYLARWGRLGGLARTVTGLLPAVLIVVVLVILNLERAVFDIMGGFRTTTSHDSAYRILVTLTGVSFLLAGPLLITWIVLVVRRRKGGGP